MDTFEAVCKTAMVLCGIVMASTVIVGISYLADKIPRKIRPITGMSLLIIMCSAILVLATIGLILYT